MEPAARSWRTTVLITTDEAVLQALRGRGWRERLRLLAGAGFTAMQVHERLGGAPGDHRTTRAEVHEVSVVLQRLAERGLVLRSRERMSVFLSTKGPRDVIVDCYRLSP